MAHQFLSLIMSSCKCPYCACMLIAQHELLGLNCGELTSAMQRCCLGRLLRAFLAAGHQAVGVQGGPSLVCDTTDNSTFSVQVACVQASRHCANYRRVLACLGCKVSGKASEIATSENVRPEMIGSFCSSAAASGDSEDCPVPCLLLEPDIAGKCYRVLAMLPQWCLGTCSCKEAVCSWPFEFTNTRASPNDIMPSPASMQCATVASARFGLDAAPSSSAR